MTRSEMKERDLTICQDARDGKTASEIARAYGLSPRRVQQILRERNIRNTRIRPTGHLQATPISRVHAKIGRAVYEHRFHRHQRLSDAAEQIGWSAIKLRRVEQGVHDLTLLDMQDLAEYLKTTAIELWSSYVEH